MRVHFNSFIHSGVGPTKIRLSGTQEGPAFLLCPSFLSLPLLSFSLFSDAFSSAALRKYHQNLLLKILIFIKILILFFFSIMVCYRVLNTLPCAIQ